MSRSRLLLLVAWGLVACLAAAQPALAQKGKGKGGGGGGNGKDRAELEINDGAVFTVRSDGKGTYVDHQLAGGDPCVASFVWGDGQYVALMDFNSNVGSGCNLLRPAADARTFSLQFPEDHEACNLFGLSGDGPVCTLELDPFAWDPQINIPEFVQQGPTQDIRVGFSFKRNGVSYGVGPADRRDISVVEDGLTSTVSHFEYGVLKEKIKNKLEQVGGQFPLAFELTITRVVQ